MKRFYECTFIVNPGLDDGQIENTVKMAEDTIVKNGGEIVNIEHIGRRRLAYPITKKHNGFYITIEFEAEGRIIDKVERFLTLDENVMRYLTVNLDARELDAKRSRKAFTLQERSKDGGPGSAKADEKTEVKADEKTEAKADEKTEAKADEKTEAKADEKIEAKADEKIEAKADEKSEAETKTEEKTEAKVEEKTEDAAEVKESEKDADEDSSEK